MTALLAHIAAEKSAIDAQLEPLRQKVALHEQLAADARADLAQVVRYMDELDRAQERIGALWNGTAPPEPLPLERAGRAALPSPPPTAANGHDHRTTDHLRERNRQIAAANRNAIARALLSFDDGEYHGAGAIAERAGVHPGTATSVLKQLLDEGLAEHNGKGGAHSRYRPLPGRTEEPATSGEAVRPSAPESSPSAESSSPDADQPPRDVGHGIKTEDLDADEAPGPAETRPAIEHEPEHEPEVPPDLAGLQDDDGVVDEDAPPAIGDAVPAGPSRRVAKLAQEAKPIAPRDDGKLSTREKGIVRMLADDPRDARELAGILVANVHEIGTDLRRLVALNLIRSRGDGRFEPTAAAAAAAA